MDSERISAVRERERPTVLPSVLGHVLGVHVGRPEEIVPTLSFGGLALVEDERRLRGGGCVPLE